MTTPFSMTRDINGYNGFGLAFTDTSYSVTLAASTATPLTIPGDTSLGRMGSTTKNRFLAVFSYTPGAEVWVSNNSTAAVPAGASFSASTSELNPGAKVVFAKDILSFITSEINISVSVALYSLS